MKELESDLIAKLRNIELNIKKNIKDYHIYGFLFGFFVSALPIADFLRGTILSIGYWILPRPPGNKTEYYFSKAIGMATGYILKKKKR